MAEASPVNNICLICNENSTDITLQCSHQFCQICISHMESTGDCKCPLCREPWKETGGNLSADDCEGNSLKKITEKIDEEILCSEHQETIAMWCKDCSVLACLTCIVTKHKSDDWCVLKDSKESILQHMTRKANQRNEAVDEEIITLENQILKDAKTVIELQNQMRITKDRIEYASKAIYERNNYIPELMSVGKYLKEHRSNVHAGVVSKCQEIVDKPIMEVPDIINSSFIDLMTIYMHSEALKDGEEWLIEDSPTAEAVVHAIASKTPSRLQIFHRDVKPNHIPVDTLSRVLGNAKSKIDVSIKCLDSFYNKNEDGIKRDKEMLETCRRNDKCKLVSFFGRLDEESLKLIPQTVECLGIGITNSEDAKLTLNSFEHLRNLQEMHLSIAVKISPGDLHCFTHKLPVLYLYIHDIDDADLEKISPIVNRLKWWLSNTYIKHGRLHVCFPRCRLSHSSVMKLPKLLARTGTYVNYLELNLLNIVLSEEEKQTVVREMRKHLSYCRGINWDMNSMLTK